MQRDFDVFVDALVCTLLFDLDMERPREELWYQYQAEVATLERFGQRNIISFDEWLVIKRYCKNETRAGI